MFCANPPIARLIAFQPHNFSSLNPLPISPPSSLAQVVVRVQGVDMARGYACGVMEAMNVPQANEPIITFWEGEIIDNANHSFFTQGWGAGR